MDKARQQICQVLKCQTPQQIIFTSGATESNNIIIQGLYNKNKQINKKINQYQKLAIITSKQEHPSIYQTIKFLQQTNDIIYLKINNDKQGFVDLDHLQQILSNGQYIPFLVSVIAASNITGVIQDICKIGQLCKKYGAFYHVDGTQIVGRYQLNTCYFDFIDSMSFSSHKYGGPKGTGCLYIKDYQQITFLPLTYGGGQQNQLRPGTENTIGIICGAKALVISQKKINQQYPNKILNYKKKIINSFSQIFKDQFVLNGPTDYQDMNKCLYNTISCQIPIKNTQLIPFLDKNKVCVSKSSACSKNSPSESLNAIGINLDQQEYSIRISMSFCNDYLSIYKLIHSIKKAHIKFCKPKTV